MHDRPEPRPRPTSIGQQIARATVDPVALDDDAPRGTLDENRAVRLLRAKAAELEHQVKYADVRGVDDLHALVADVALIASLLADDIESRHGGRRVQMQEPGDTGDLR